MRLRLPDWLCFVDPEPDSCLLVRCLPSRWSMRVKKTFSRMMTRSNAFVINVVESAETGNRNRSIG
jgi:hypothetical protein